MNRGHRRLTYPPTFLRGKPPETRLHGPGKHYNAEIAEEKQRGRDARFFLCVPCVLCVQVFYGVFGAC